MHKIPNFAFGKVAIRSVIRVFLPHMYGMNDSAKIPVTDMELIYNQSLRPVVVQHMSNMATHWPVSYSTALALYRDNKSRIHPGSLDIPEHILDVFSKEYLKQLGKVRPYFRDAYFVHEFRGWKGATIHNPFDVAEREVAFSDLTHDLNMDKVDTENWFVDIALEVGVEEHIATWRTSGHKSLLRHCLPSLNTEGLDNLTNKHAFSQDRMMHLLDLSGFHCETGKHGKEDDVKYIQAYTTEKTMAYQLHQGLFTDKNPQDLLMTPKLEKLVQDIEKMSLVLFECTGDGEDQKTPQDGCARIEVRVPMSKALTTLTTCPSRLLRRCVVAIPAQDWW